MSVTSAATPGAGSVAPVAQWGDHDRHGHAVQFYSDDSFLLDGLARFIGTALGGGDSAVVIATRPHREGLAQRLKARGLNTAAAIEQRRYIVLDAAETLSKFMADGLPDEKRFTQIVGQVIEGARAAAQGEAPRVAAFGEMVALLWAQGDSEAAIRLERLWNDLARTHSFSLRCAYPMKHFDRGEHGENLLKICEEHSSVIPDESYTALSSEEARLRSIAHLQQKAQALANETAERKAVQKSLRVRESELADILENAVEGVQQVGSDQRILWANRAMLDLLGYAPAEYLSRHVADFYIHRQDFDELWRRLMLRENIYDYSAQLKAKDGSVKHVLIHSNGLWDGERFVHTRCFIRDVTEQKGMEQALRLSERHAAMGRLAATIAHEINSPLETVMNVFYLLRDQPSLDEHARSLARTAEEEISRVGHIARQTLAFYRESEGPVSLSLRGVLEDVLGLYSRQLHLKRISVKKQIATDGFVLAFPVEIRQVFVNLIGNAVQAMPDGGTLRVAIRGCTHWTQRSGRGGVRVSVTDTGSGVLPAYREKLFQPFVTTKAEKGNGLGLWVSRGIVQKLDGTIRFRSSCLGGRTVTSFSVFIPGDSVGVGHAA